MSTFHVCKIIQINDDTKMRAKVIKVMYKIIHAMYHARLPDVPFIYREKSMTAGHAFPDHWRHVPTKMADYSAQQQKFCFQRRYPCTSVQRSGMAIEDIHRDTYIITYILDTGMYQPTEKGSCRSAVKNSSSFPSCRQKRFSYIAAEKKIEKIEQKYR